MPHSLKIYPAPKVLPTRLMTAALRETLPRLQQGESVVVPITRSVAQYNARKVSVDVLIEETGVPTGHVRVMRK